MGTKIFKSNCDWEAQTKKIIDGKQFFIYTYRNFHHEIYTSASLSILSKKDEEFLSRNGKFCPRFLVVNHGNIKVEKNDIERFHLEVIQTLEEKVKEAL